jgi:hypothetical protein
MVKKYLFGSFAAVAALTLTTSCSNEDVFDASKDINVAKYEAKFLQKFGQPAATQDWGFGTGTSTRAAEPSVPNIAAPYDAAWVADYLTTAKEADYNNTRDNHDNGTTFGWANYIYNGIANDADYTWFQEYCYPATQNNWSYYRTHFGLESTEWNDVLAWLYPQIINRGHEDWLSNVNIDNTYVTNFKITGTYSDYIDVAASEGSQTPGCERTIVVTGTWNITADQTIGSLGRIIIANGGTVNVASGKKLHMVNQAQLVVLQGGKLTGEGAVEINNGTAEGKEAYNGGVIDVKTFNNNFGKFYNYGKFLVNEYLAGATESNFYNHGIVAIDHTAGDANARVFNGCQFYVKNNARLRNYEGVNGSALIVGGQFMPFGSEDGTSVPSFVNLAAGALVKCGSLYNGSSWTGPAEGGYAALEIVNQIDYLNWVQDSPQTAGYFANNIYVKCGTWQNDPAGQGKHEDVDDGSEWGHRNYTESRAEYKFFQIAANCIGNGNVTKVEDGDYEYIPASEGFVLGEKECTPGFKFKKDDQEENPYVIRVMAEDLSVQDINADFDFNDVVFDVAWTETGAKIRLNAAGGTLPLRINGNIEVHEKFAEANPGKKIQTDPAKGKLTMINTATNAKSVYVKPEFEITGNFKDNSGKNNARLIKIEVNKGTIDQPNWIELTAEVGKVAAKFGCDPKTDWADERQDIEKKYANFGKWVRGDASFFQ